MSAIDYGKTPTTELLRFAANAVGEPADPKILRALGPAMAAELRLRAARMEWDSFTAAQRMAMCAARREGSIGFGAERPWLRPPTVRALVDRAILERADELEQPKSQFTWKLTEAGRAFVETWRSAGLLADDPENWEASC